MKLSVSNKVSTIYKALGVPKNKLLAKSFPSVLLDDYRVAWFKFIKTRMARDLLKNNHYGKARVCAAFVSYICSIDDKCWSNYSVNMDEINTLDVSADFQAIRHFLHIKGFGELFKVREHTDVNFRDVDFIRAGVGIVYSGYAIYTPRGKTTLEGFLRQLVPTTFKAFPIELERTPQLNTLLASKLNWLAMLDTPTLKLEVGRAIANQLVFRWRINPDAVVFYGNNSTGYVQKYLNQFQESL